MSRWWKHFVRRTEIGYCWCIYWIWKHFKCFQIENFFFSNTILNKTRCKLRLTITVNYIISKWQVNTIYLNNSVILNSARNKKAILIISLLWTHWCIEAIYLCGATDSSVRLCILKYFNNIAITSFVSEFTDEKYEIK